MVLILACMFMTLATAVWFWKAAASGNQNKYAWAAIGALAVTFPPYLALVIYVAVTVTTVGPSGLTGIHAIVSTMVLAGIACVCGSIASRILLKRIEKEKELQASYSQKTCMDCKAILESWASICPTCQSERFRWE